MITQILSYSNYHFVPLAVLTLVTALIQLALGLWVLYLERCSRLSIAFFLICISLQIWLYSFSWMYLADTPSIALFWARLSYLGVSFGATTIYYFSTCELPEPAKHRLSAWLGFFTSAVFVALAWCSDQFIAGMQQFSWGPYPAYGPYGALFIAFFALMTTLSLFHFSRASRLAQPGSSRALRGKFFFYAFFVCYLGSIDFLPKYGIDIYPLGFLCVLGMSGLTAWTIKHYQLTDITPASAAPNILATMQDALFTIDPEGNILLANAAAADLVGIDANSLRHRSLSDFLSFPHGSSLFPTQQSQKQPLQREIPCQLPTGAYKILAFSCSPFLDKAGAVIATVVAVRDITEKKITEKKLQDAYDDLEEKIARRTAELDKVYRHMNQSEKLVAVGKMAASVAHEFGSPIFAIRNLLTTMRDAPAEGVDPQLLDLGIQECERLRSMLDNLRDCYAPATEKKGPVALHRIMDNVLLLYDKKFRDKKINIRRRYATNLPMFYGVENQLKQVIVNLLSNAEEAISNKGSITISSAHSKDHISLSIADTGCGISADAIDHIFEPFISSKDEKIGTGLGLAISYGIVKAHGGTLTVKSTAGQGSVFTITLPLTGAIAALPPDGNPFTLEDSAAPAPRPAFTPLSTGL